ncbi:tRNA (guanosine(18)-2'-O)-methyltransferase TARBP1 isoform X1 [Osmia lignaria lignaria]|uniref:tRNA (guanosine(18)-2'-O)-methyltransferase TARBP1 isoform X1 n=1 Tax=Osmia lignaria lignaria TaxID=1437193 RepID=UPI00402B49D1
MDLHERYMRSTMDFSVFELSETAFKDDPLLLLHRIVKYYNNEIMKDNFDTKKLETFRIVLCYEYQLLFNSKEKNIKVAASDLCFKTIESILFLKKHSQNFTEHPILYDIITLQLILYCNLQCIEEHLMNFQKSNVDVLNNDESKFFYIKILECFLESLQLRHLLYNNADLSILKHFSLLYLKDIITWLEMKENKEWQLFTSIFPKLISTCSSENILPIIWNVILNKLDDFKDLLSALSIIVNVCFSSNFINDVIHTHYKLFYTEQLWLLIIKSLKSPIQQYRKQGLFIMKHITNFMNITNENVLKLKIPSIVPFVCGQKTETKILIKDIKQKFFLILDALEEKQHHLILPALTNLSTLIKGNEEHTLCNDCFNTIWLQLIFERILQHENNNIVKQGVLFVCKLYTFINDNQFLKLFVHVLNNTFLYECQSYQDEPDILSSIIILFIHVTEEETEFPKRLLKIMSEETWAPIPIFYVIKVLRTVTSKTLNQWGDDELILVKSLVQKNLNMHSHILRIASQVELIKTICFSIGKVNNLEIVIETLLEFSLEDTLVRESFSWEIVVNWLKEVLIKKHAIDFIKFICEQFSSQDSHVKLSPAKFAVVIAMFYDTGLILQHKTCVVFGILNNWLSILNGINTRPYVNHTYIFYAIEFMSHLFNLNVIKTDETIIQLLSSYFNDSLQFLFKNSKSIPYKFSYEEINKYLIIIVSFLNNKNLILSEKEILNHVERFRSQSIFILQNIKQYTNMHYMYALHILYHTQEILYKHCTLLYVESLLDISNIHMSNNDQDSHVQDQVNTKGKITSNCYLLLAKLLNQFLEKKEIQLWPQNINWFKSTLCLYEMGGNEIVPEIASILKTIINKGAIKDIEDKLHLESIFTLCWKSTLLSKKNKLYFIAIKDLVGVVINDNFLKLPDVMHFVNNFLDQLLEESNNVPKLKQILLNEMESLNTCYLKNLQEPLVSCCLHGHVLRRDKQIENQAYLYVTQNYRNYYPRHISIIDYNNDNSVRALSIILLYKIINADKEYASMLLPIVLQKLEKFRNKRYFNHSYIHKIKHRIMQILLILQPILNKLDIVILEDCLCNLMLLESNQHSIRLMQEWILIKIFVENIELHYKLWKFFEEGITTRPGCVSSIACIVYHVSRLLPSDSQCDFILMGIKYIAHCCLGQQYSMRLYNQIIFVKLYKMLEQFNCNDTIVQYKGLYDAAIASLKYGNLAINSSKIQDDFYFSVFHAVHDFSLQTIYFELPRLTDMDPSEWITPDLFQILNFKETINHPLQLYNLNTLLSDTKTSSYLMKSTVDKESSVKNSMMDIEELNNIQKKIDPLMPTNISHNDIFSTIRESVSHKRLSDEDGLIVVACLVNRAPNLGGLTRTCEIFNVKELVIANLNQIKDKEFQNLSVSAENWITITEVKPHQLCKFLLDKKEMGWSLVGLEQTVNSVNLINMKFKKKTILVLGNEKDGIPANLISLFDTCIEIPQAGIIRSLNVHVSGAICIWQYSKQHVLI